MKPWNELSDEEKKLTTVINIFVENKSYICDNGRRIEREYGKSPNGTNFNGTWVYRDVNGDIIDFDQYRADLFQRNNLREIYS